MNKLRRGFFFYKIQINFRLTEKVARRVQRISSLNPDPSNVNWTELNSPGRLYSKLMQ